VSARPTTAAPYRCPDRDQSAAAATVEGDDLTMSPIMIWVIG